MTQHYIKEWREQLRMTQADVAKLIGKTQTTYAGYESGEHSPTLTTLDRVAKALGVKPAQLLEPPTAPVAPDWQTALKDLEERLSWLECGVHAAAIVLTPRRPKCK